MFWDTTTVSQAFLETSQALYLRQETYSEEGSKELNAVSSRQQRVDEGRLAVRGTGRDT